MNILMVNHFPLEGSGSGIYTLNLAKELSKRGHNVKVIHPEHGPVAYPDFENRVLLFRDDSRPEQASNKRDEPLHQEEEGLKFNFPCFTTHPRSHATFYDLDADQIEAYTAYFTKVVEEEVESFKPDIIHAQHLWITPYAALKTGVPYVVTAHGTDIKGFKKDDRYHDYALAGARGSRCIITISKEVDHEVGRLYGIPTSQRQLIQNGYDDTLFMPLPLDRRNVLARYGILESCPKMVFFAGKLAHFKGVDVLLKSAAHYEAQYGADVCTVIAGSGDMGEELGALTHELGLKGTHFIGHVSQQQLAELYSVSDVDIVPSRNEPFGLVAIEALACGTPVVGTNQGGLPDFVHGDVGQLVDVEDDRALADAIMDELSREDAQARRQICASYAKDHFSWKKAVEEVELLYMRILKDKKEGIPMCDEGGTL